MKSNKICAELSSQNGRRLDDDAMIMLKLETSARGIINVSQVLPGEENS